MTTLSLLIVGAKWFLWVKAANAIVILPALVLIPIAKLVAVVVAAFALPATSLGVYISSVTKNRRLGILLPVVILLVVGLVSFVAFLYFKPDNPIF